MKFTTPNEHAWACFIAWASEENWTVPAFEVDLLRTALEDSTLALLNGDRCSGFVTTVSYEKSGWIGNLIVPPEQRGRGLGRRLFEKALDRLNTTAPRSIWLTASKAGQPLYEQYGFVDIGGVDRMIRPPVHVLDTPKSLQPANPDNLLRFDHAVWGESRVKLLAPLAKNSVCFVAGDAGCFLQQHRDLQVIGPAYAPQRSEQQLEAALGACLVVARTDLPVIIDLITGHPATRVLLKNGFRRSGHNRLMTKGCHDHVNRGSLVSFASLGSMG